MPKTDTTDESLEAGRRPGRPRSARADRAILKATSELLVETGYGGMSVEAVAARAQVGKATIYRRWASKKALVAEVLRQLSDDVRMPDTGNTREDLIALLLDFRRVTSASYIGPMTGRVISAAISNPEFMPIYWENTILPRRKAVTEILRRGQARGELRSDLDLDLVLDILPGAAIYRALISKHGLEHAQPVDPEELVNTIWSGISSDGVPPHRKHPRC
jgi:AcrR family transcriptional regulator